MTKIFTVSCVADSGGFDWVDFGSFGIGPSAGGSMGNSRLGSHQMPIILKRMCSAIQKTWRLLAETYYGDNFSETGGIAPPPTELRGTMKVLQEHEITIMVQGLVIAGVRYEWGRFHRWALAETAKLKSQRNG